MQPIYMQVVRTGMSRHSSWRPGHGSDTTLVGRKIFSTRSRYHDSRESSTVPTLDWPDEQSGKSHGCHRRGSDLLTVAVDDYNLALAASLGRLFSHAAFATPLKSLLTTFPAAFLTSSSNSKTITGTAKDGRLRRSRNRVSSGYVGVARG